ncbi:hypothetical protein J6590_048912 [Homalodisca vitripennis]|nr:hypothetical protein J6590_048912 [Homalodisca vitripennis]
MHNNYKNEPVKITKGECKKSVYKNSMYSVSLQVAKCHQRTTTTVSNTTVPYRRDGHHLAGKTSHKPIQNNGRKKMPPSYPEYVELQANTTNEVQPNCSKALNTTTLPLNPQRNHHFLVERCQPDKTTNEPVKTRKPPITAMKRPEDQSIQDFYNKNITFFIHLNGKPHTTENNFLEKTQEHQQTT